MTVGKFVPHFLEHDPVLAEHILPKDGVIGPERLLPHQPEQGTPSAALREIRLSLGLTQGEMASRLGLNEATYRVYEYSRVSTFQPEILDRARRLLAQDDYSYLRDRYRGKKMSEIATEWAARIGIEPTDTAAFAQALTVNKSTVLRWMRDDTEPSLQELIRYDALVTKIEKRFSRVALPNRHRAH